MGQRDKQKLFRRIPKVDRVLMSSELQDASLRYPRSLIARGVSQVLDGMRARIESGEDISEEELALGFVCNRVIEVLESMSRPRLRPVINCTGVVVHTNLGRSILADKVLERFRSVAGGYSNLEYSLELGKRGSRHVHVAGILKELTGAEDAMVVNNNAAAVLLCLETIARGRRVVVSRGELVEIGGSFRIPDVMGKSGAIMVEVGTTNKTHAKDYREMIDPETALLLKVHRSNFDLVGFTQEVSIEDLVALGKPHGIPVMQDLGSGCLVDLSKYGLRKEPTVQETLKQGADLVTFSGDKLLGGPQAGIILGRKDLMDAIKKNQLARALRIDKLTLVALEETLRIYRDEVGAIREIPTLAMICEPYASVRRRANRLRRLIGNLETEGFVIEFVDGDSAVGGGALPLSRLQSRLICLRPQKLKARFMERWLRAYDPPLVPRVEKDSILMDVRTIQNDQFKIVATALRRLAVLEAE